ncbi:MFS transporter [Lottiidibacillus patelloidae]|uniref:MFS transporter n=1 Tax=Lottiidibacillus patelloidae TaxID=2670334 RepID=A0A263BRX3_9BACI|nr:MFS transporter [Lottiidibacillus patelloidae]OZM56117.1 MFS transporter [Lottiidibacillus patelloidae]
MPRSLWLLIIGMIINVTGASFLWPLNTIYIHLHLGKSLSLAGMVLMLNAAAGIAGNLIGGLLFDRFGGYKSILIGLSITMTSAFLLVPFHSWTPYVVLMIVLGFGAGIMFPSIYAMAGSVWPEGGRKAFNAIYVAQNLGVAVGAALGGLVADYKFEYIFIANGFMYFMFFLLVLFTYRPLAKKAADNAQGTTSILEQKFVIKNRTKLTALLTLCVAYLLAWLAYCQWQATISAHTQTLGISLKQYSLLWTINGALIVLGQPFASMLVKRAKSLKSQITLGLVIFIFSFIILIFAEQFSIFVIAMIVLTIGEMLVWPAVPTIANSLAPKGREGFYQGIVNSTATGGRMIGPLFGGIIVDLYGIQMLFYLLIGLFFIAIFATLTYDLKLKRENEQVSV